MTFVDFQGIGTSSNSQITTQICRGISAIEAPTMAPGAWFSLGLLNQFFEEYQYQFGAILIISIGLPKKASAGGIFPFEA